MENQAFISLGSNIGDRYEYLRNAVQRLTNYPEIELVNYSSIYETDPVGYEDQDLFLNMVIQVKTSWSAARLLDMCLKTELELGRKRDVRWGPRTIDLDILLYNQENITTEKLIVPHPRMLERPFVMIPLLELCPEKTFCHQTHEASSSELPNSEGVRIWKLKNGEDVFEPIGS